MKAKSYMYENYKAERAWWRVNSWNISSAIVLQSQFEP